METRTLKYFLAIAKEENMTNAANILHISQSALSRQMAELEKELKTTLFERTNRQTLLTEEGVKFKQRAEEIISLIEKTESEFLSSSDDISGKILIGAGETKAFAFIANAIKRVQRKYPNIQFVIYDANAIDIMERLEHGIIDFGLIFEPFSKDNYDFFSLPASDDVGILVSRNNKIARKQFVMADDLLKLPLIVSARFNPGSIFPPDKLSSLKLNIKATYNLLYNASIMVEEGVGSAVTIKGLINTDNNEKLVFIPLKPEVKMHTVFMWKKHRLLSKAAEIFLNELKKICRIQ